MNASATASPDAAQPPRTVLVTGAARRLGRDAVADPLLPVDGHLPVTRPEPDPAALDAAAQDPDLAARWERRLAEVTAALETRGAAR